MVSNTPVLAVEGAMALLRVVQEQHDWVELFFWPIISPQRYDEVVQSVPGRLGRHNYELVLKAVRFGILKAIMFTTLQKRDRDTMLPHTENTQVITVCVQCKGWGFGWL